MKSRIVKVRQDAGMTQTAFADKIGLSKNYVWMIENGQREPGDRTISDICRIFGIREEWLRYGIDPMRAPRSEEEEIAEMVGAALTGSSKLKRAVVRMICSKSEEDLAKLEAMLRELYESIAE